MRRVSRKMESEYLIRLGEFIDRIYIREDTEITDRDIELLRALERYICDNLVREA